jgi:hypothetical protein
MCWKLKSQLIQRRENTYEWTAFRSEKKTFCYTNSCSFNVSTCSQEQNLSLFCETSTNNLKILQYSETICLHLMEEVLKWESLFTVGSKITARRESCVLFTKWPLCIVMHP